jgi:phosphatidylglycerol:prolipoprotein diacylglycerol transferase
VNALFLAVAGPIVVHPFQFGVWRLNFTGFGIAVVMSFVVAQMIAQQEMERMGHDSSPVGDIVIGAIIGGLLGAKLYFVFVLGNHDALFSRGGFVFWGGLIGGTTGSLLVARFKRVPLLRFIEAGTPGLAAAYAVGRTGCWTVGDDYGRPWNGPLAVQFPEGAPPSTAGNMASEFGVHFPAGTNPATLVAVHPTQLYEVAMGLVMFAVIWRLRRHAHREGWLFGVYLILGGAERFVVEFFRAKDDQLAIGFTIAQVIALTAFAAGIAWLVTLRGRRPAAVSA